MKPDELTTLFGVQLKVFEPIVGQPTDDDITLLREVLTALLYPIHYDHRKRKVVYRVGYSVYAHTITNGMLVIDYNQHILDRVNFFHNQLYTQFLPL